MDINLYDLHAVKMQNKSENIFIKSLRFVCTLHSIIKETYYRQLFLILVAATFNTHKATFG